LVRTNVINITLSYKHTLYTEVAYTNYLANSLNIYAGKTPVLSFSVLFTYLFTNKKLYYNSSLFLNKSRNLTNIGL